MRWTENTVLLLFDEFAKMHLQRGPSSHSKKTPLGWFPKDDLYPSCTFHWLNVFFKSWFLYFYLIDSTLSISLRSLNMVPVYLLIRNIQRIMLYLSIEWRQPCWPLYLLDFFLPYQTVEMNLFGWLLSNLPVYIYFWLFQWESCAILRLQYGLNVYALLYGVHCMLIKTRPFVVVGYSILWKLGWYP